MNPYEPSQLMEQQAASPAPLAGGSVLWQWERRRLFFNLVVVAGIFGITAFLLPHVLFDALTWRINFYALVAANLLYFAGPLLELSYCALTGQRFRQGILPFALLSIVVLLLLLSSFYRL